jgi:hypothetical protein
MKAKGCIVAGVFLLFAMVAYALIQDVGAHLSHSLRMLKTRAVSPTSRIRGVGTA